MTVRAALVTPVSAAIAGACRLIAQRVTLRWREAADTASVELSLFAFGLVNGAFSLLFPGGFRDSWALLSQVANQRTFALLVIAQTAFRAASILNGSIRLRLLVCWVGFMFAGISCGMVWTAYHRSPVAPFYLVLALMNLYCIGRLAKIGAKYGGGV